MKKGGEGGRRRGGSEEEGGSEGLRCIRLKEYVILKRVCICNCLKTNHSISYVHFSL